MSEQKTLKTLSEWNKERSEHHWNSGKAKPNGIACPHCGKELFDTEPNSVLTSMPPQKVVGCMDCGWKGKRIA